MTTASTSEKRKVDTESASASASAADDCNKRIKHDVTNQNQQLPKQQDQQHKKNPKNSKKINKKDPYNDIPNIRFTITEIPPSHEPGSPHSVFSSSYNVTLSSVEPSSSSNVDTNETQKDKNQSTKVESNESHKNNILTEQIIHSHQNTLCIVTAGSANNLPSNNGNDISITNIQFLKTVDASQIGGKNKKHKSKNKSTHPNTVHPQDPLCQITYSNGDQRTLYCCVYGRLLELNPNLTKYSSTQQQQAQATDLKPNPLLTLQQDPLMNGYLAIILPLQTFPPSSFSISKQP